MHRDWDILSVDTAAEFPLSRSEARQCSHAPWLFLRRPGQEGSSRTETHIFGSTFSQASRRGARACIPGFGPARPHPAGIARSRGTRRGEYPQPRHKTRRVPGYPHRGPSCTLHAALPAARTLHLHAATRPSRSWLGMGACSSRDVRRGPPLPAVAPRRLCRLPAPSAGATPAWRRAGAMPPACGRRPLLHKQAQRRFGRIDGRQRAFRV